MVIIPHRRKAFRSSGSGAAGSDPYFSNVVLLMHFEAANGSTTFIDSSLANRTFTANGNAQISTTEKKVGTSSMAVDGSGDYIITNSASEDFNFGTSTDFTIEGWVYVISGGSSGTSSNWFTTTSRSYYFGLYLGYIAIGNGVTNISLSYINFAPYLDKWTYVTHSRSGANNYIFLNGVLQQTASNASLGSNDSLNIGRDPYFGPLMNGYIDDVRITKGVCRYTTNFTPPTAAFPDN